MRRSQLNEILAESQALFAKHQIALPPFAHFTPNEWAKHDLSRYQEVFDLQLGWDVTDMGSNDFSSTGLTLFTLRNGSVGGKPYPKPYAEKIMISREGQVTPSHSHYSHHLSRSHKTVSTWSVLYVQDNPAASLCRKSFPLHEF
jgi:D-lyxose ketol-isomerase